MRGVTDNGPVCAGRWPRPRAHLGCNPPRRQRASVMAVQGEGLSQATASESAVGAGDDATPGGAAPRGPGSPGSDEIQAAPPAAARGREGRGNHEAVHRESGALEDGGLASGGAANRDGDDDGTGWTKVDQIYLLTVLCIVVAIAVAIYFETDGCCCSAAGCCCSVARVSTCPKCSAAGRTDAC